MTIRTYADLVRPQAKTFALIYDIILVVSASLLLSLSNFVIRIPIGGTPVPITGQTFAVLFSAVLLGAKRAPAAVALYLFYGLVGLPWYSGGVLLGATGGYLFGFLAAAFVVGHLAEAGFDRKYYTTIVAMFIGEIVIFTFGLIWLQQFSGQLLGKDVFSVGLFPFIPGDLFKIALAVSLLPSGWKLINKQKKNNQ